MSLTAKDIETITRMLEASSFDELDLELEGVKLSLRRRGAVSAAPATGSALAVSGAPGLAGSGAPPVAAGAGASGVPAAAHPASAAPLGSAAAAPAFASSPAAPAPVVGPDALTAPLLGTFYRSPRPGEPPFVEVGSLVEPDTVVAIIEVMKLMNAVHAGRKGRVTEILALDGALVEYGQALLRIEPDGGSDARQ